MAGKKTYLDGHVFDSKFEAGHYAYLKSLSKVKIIKLQPEFQLFEGFEYFDLKKNKIIKYRKMIYTGDFLIELPDIDKPIVVESKGFSRPDYEMRRKLFINKYNKEYYFFQSDKLKDCVDYFGKYK